MSSAGPDPSAATEASAPPKPRRLLWLWVTSFGFLALVGAFCFLLLKPYLETRRAAERLAEIQRNLGPGAETVACAKELVEELGGSKEAARKLALYVRLPDRMAPRKGWAFALVFHCGSDGVPSLISLLNASDFRTREWAAEFLGGTGDHRAVEPLIGALKDASPYVQDSAARSLGKLGDPRAIPALEALVSGKADDALRIKAGRALEQCRRNSGP